MDILSGLPDEIIVHIMIFLDVVSLCKLDLVAKRYKMLSDSNVIWKIKIVGKFPWIRPESLPTISSDQRNFYESIIGLINKVRGGIKDETPNVNDMLSVPNVYVDPKLFIVDRAPYLIKPVYLDPVISEHCYVRRLRYLVHSYEVRVENNELRLIKSGISISIMTEPTKVNKILKMGSYKELRQHYYINEDLWKFGLKIGYLYEK